MHKLGPTDLTVIVGDPLERSGHVPAQLCQLPKTRDRRQKAWVRPPPVVQWTIRLDATWPLTFWMCVNVSSEGGHLRHSPAFVIAWKQFSAHYTRHV